MNTLSFENANPLEALADAYLILHNGQTETSEESDV